MNFGLTYLGPEYTFAPYKRTSLCLDDLSDADLLNAFTSFTSSRPAYSSYSRSEDKQGLLCADDVRSLLMQVYGREPPELEIKLFLEAMQTFGSEMRIVKLLERTAMYVDVEQFKQCIAKVRQQLASVNSNAATEFTSNLEMTGRKDKGTTFQHDPKEKYRMPVTTSSQYGWYTQLPHERVERKPQKSCEETRFASEMVKSGQY